MDSTTLTNLQSLRLVVEAFSGEEEKERIPESILKAIRQLRQIGLKNQSNSEIVRSSFIAQSELLKLLVSIVTTNIFL
jgi:hypothetical protein